MNVKVRTTLALVGVLCYLATSATVQAITPSFATNKEVSFGSVMFSPGNCTISHTNGFITDANPDTMCGVYGNGQAGRYIIIANPNKQVRIKILQRDNPGDGFMFIPEGELISDTETLTITTGIAQDIDSGPSGIINIHIGGRLFVISQASPNTSYNLLKNDGIEWSELP